MTNNPLDENIEVVVVPRSSDLGGGFVVQRALPSTQRRMVGPFVFFDQMGPTMLAPGKGLDVLPHPHIGLATVTYLFSGQILHRDSLGSVQPIQPGALNWMVAGSGIVHSERTPDALRDIETSLFGIQVWVALPRSHEEVAPSFRHFSSDTLPVIDADGVRVRLIIGSLFGERAPVEVFSEMFYADALLAAGTTLDVPPGHEERAVYVVEGRVRIGSQSFDAGRLIVLTPGTVVTLHAAQAVRLMLLGGEPMDSHRYVWWNFVSSSRERIEQAKADWREGRFAAVPGESGFIPLPGGKVGVVKYP